MQRFLIPMLGAAALLLGPPAGLGLGALVGTIGAAAEMALLAFADMPLGVPDQLILAGAYTIAGGALTNALGGAAGQALASRRA